jgi:hypothetical protein
MKKFRAPESALHCFEAHTPTPVSSPVLHFQDNSSQTDSSSGDIVTQTKSLLETVSEEEQGQFIAPPNVNVPLEFVSHALACMKTLKEAGRFNILAGLAKALGTKRADGSDSRMSVSKMPVGLIEYAASFVSSDSNMHTCVN